MEFISTSNIFGKAWEIFQQNGSDLVVISFVYVFISCILSIMDSATTGANYVIVFIISIACGILQMVLSLGFYRILLDTINSEKPQLAELFSQRNSNLILHYIIGSIVSGVAIVIGFIFLIIPGIYLATRLQFFHLRLLEQENPDCIKALTDSWNMTENHVLDLIGLGFITCCIVILGFLALIVGLIVAIPIVGLMSTIAYCILSKKMEKDLPLNL